MTLPEIPPELLERLCAQSLPVPEGTGAGAAWPVVAALLAGMAVYTLAAGFAARRFWLGAGAPKDGVGEAFWLGMFFPVTAFWALGARWARRTYRTRPEDDANPKGPYR